VPTYDLGDGVNLRHLVYDRDGVLTDATVALAINKPDGTTALGSVTRTSLGQYDASTYVTDQVGDHTYVWSVTGAVTDVDYGGFSVANPAPQNYTSVAMVKAALNKETDDTRDDLIDIAIRAASRRIDQICGRRFYADRAVSARTFPTARRVFRSPYGAGLLIDDVASSTGLLLETGSVGSYSSVSTFYPGPDNAIAYGQPITYLQANSAWLSGVTSIRVTARWGWPTVPDEVALATQLLAARLYRRKDSPQGVIANADWGTVRVSRVDPDVEALVSHLILPGFA
jgi:hypothetical protein